MSSYSYSPTQGAILSLVPVFDLNIPASSPYYYSDYKPDGSPKPPYFGLVIQQNGEDYESDFAPPGVDVGYAEFSGPLLSQANFSSDSDGLQPNFSASGCQSTSASMCMLTTKGRWQVLLPGDFPAFSGLIHLAGRSTALTFRSITLREPLAGRSMAHRCKH